MKPGARGPSRSSGAPDRQRRVADDQHDAERRGELQELGRGVDALQQQRLDQRAERRDGERRDAARRPRSRAGRGRSASLSVVRDVRAQHVQRAVREVDDAGDAEDQRQAGGDEEQRRRAGEAVQELREQGGGGHASGIGRRRASAEAAILARGRVSRRCRCDGLAGRMRALASVLGSRSIRRPHPLHRVVRGQVVLAVGVAPVDHHALAVLDRGAADVRAHRRLMVERRGR